MKAMPPGHNRWIPRPRPGMSGSKSTIMTRKLGAVAGALLLAACVTAGSHHLAYNRAHVHGPDSPDGVRGVLLILHGCGGTFPRDWWKFMVRQGFLTVWINSFDDPRPPKSCVQPFPNKPAIYAIRTRQANHALDGLRATYAGLPLIVWGHSEGGGVAHQIDARGVAGIITTGYQCGYRATGSTRIPDDIPWLAVTSDGDPHMLYPSLGPLRATCEGIQRNKPKWSHLILRGSYHRPALDSFREPLMEFLARAI